MKIFSTQHFSLRKLWLALIPLLVLSLIAFRFIERRGVKTKAELIDSYISAIRQENPNQILKLVPSSHVLDQTELNNIIMHAGGKELNNFQISYIPSESPQLEIVKLTGTYKKNGDATEFTDMLYLQKIDNRWYLLLGRDKNGLPIDAPSSKID